MKATSPSSPFTSEDKFYNWQGYQCSYEYYPAVNPNNQDISLLLIHPIGVGLSGNFWYRFCQESRQQELNHAIYNPDLIGCGNSEIPKVAYYPQDWAEQLHYFLQNIIQKPVIIVVQGALLPVAIALTQLQNQSNSNLIKGLILSGPPAWKNNKNLPGIYSLILPLAIYSGSMLVVVNLSNPFPFVNCLLKPKMSIKIG